MKRPYTFVLVIMLATLACSVSSSPEGTVQTAVAGTHAYESLLATGLAATLAAGATPTLAPPVEVVETVAPSATPEPQPTATSVRIAPPLPGATELEYGQTVGAMPRQESLMYTFTGTQDDSVLVRVVVSNARPKMPFCDGRAMRSDWVVMTDKLVAFNPSSYTSNRAISGIYTLPYTGRYYISATCRGPGCDAFCAELDVHVEKNK